MTITGKIDLAEVQHCNGDSTAKEMVVSATTIHEDGDGKFDYPDQFVVPVPWSFPLGEHPHYKKVTITIE